MTSLLVRRYPPSMTRSLAVFLTLTLLVVACSDDDGEPPVTPPPGAGGATSTATTGGEGGDGSSAGGAGGMDGADTWGTFAMAFMDTYCVECHTVGDPEGRDYTLYAEIVEEADTIRCGVTPTELPDCTGFPPPAQFPVGSGAMPTDDERQRIVDWIDAGLPE